MSFDHHGKRKVSFQHLLNPVRQLPGLLVVIVKRQRHYLGLSLLALLNIILAVGLITNASFFAEAVDRVVLLQELKDFSSATNRPPFSTSVYVFPSRRQPLTLENAEQLANHIGQTIAGEVGLPLRHLGTEVSSGSLTLLPDPSSTLFAGKETLGTIETVYIANVADQMEIIEGAAMDEQGSSKETVDVWIHETNAQGMGIHIGEKMALGINRTDIRKPIRVAGIWRAKNPQDPFWFNNPDSAYKNTLLVRRQDYIQFIQPILGTGSAQASWYVILDENRIIPGQSQQYLDGFKRSLDIINKYLPGSRMNMPPLDPLAKFVQRSATLTVLLIGYNLPAYAILLYFLVLTSGVMAQWQRRETVMLVSRGMS